MSTKSGIQGAVMTAPGGGETTASSGEQAKARSNMHTVCPKNQGCPEVLGYLRTMNDSDWLRKHLRGKTQRAVAETSASPLRRLIGRALGRIRGARDKEPKRPGPPHKAQD